MQNNRGNSKCQCLRVSTAVERKHDHGDLDRKTLKWACMTVCRFSPLRSMVVCRQIRCWRKSRDLKLDPQTLKEDCAKLDQVWACKTSKPQTHTSSKKGTPPDITTHYEPAVQRFPVVNIIFKVLELLNDSKSHLLLVSRQFMEIYCQLIWLRRNECSFLEHWD